MSSLFEIRKNIHVRHFLVLFQQAIECSKLTIETIEQSVKYDQS